MPVAQRGERVAAGDDAGQHGGIIERVPHPLRRGVQHRRSGNLHRVPPWTSGSVVPSSVSPASVAYVRRNSNRALGSSGIAVMGTPTASSTAEASTAETG